jgi:hypothetical protein
LRIVADTLVEFDVETVEEVFGEGPRGGCGVGFEVGWEGGFEGLEGGLDRGGLEVLDCVDEVACSEEEVD